MSSEEIDFTDPSGAGNFLERYHQARAASANATAQAVPKSTPSTPTKTERTPPPPPPLSPLHRARSMPTGPSEIAKSVWGAVFHPLGHSPTSADRYDLSPKQNAEPGSSTSELHAKGSGISLDDRRAD